MSVRSYYRWALLLPLAVPLLAHGVTMLENAPALLIVIVFYTYAALVVGGIPYLLFAMGFLLWTRGRADDEVRRAVLLAPVVYTALLTVCLVLILAFDSGLAGGGGLLAGAATFGLGFGYAYVALAEVGRVLLRPGRIPAHPTAA